MAAESGEQWSKSWRLINPNEHMNHFNWCKSKVFSGRMLFKAFQRGRYTGYTDSYLVLNEGN
jgi:hypothetical protein